MEHVPLGVPAVQVQLAAPRPRRIGRAEAAAQAEAAGGADAPVEILPALTYATNNSAAAAGVVRVGRGCRQRVGNRWPSPVSLPLDAYRHFFTSFFTSSIRWYGTSLEAASRM